jgi:hypothetical protein
VDELLGRLRARANGCTPISPQQLTEIEARLGRLPELLRLILTDIGEVGPGVERFSGAKILEDTLRFAKENAWKSISPSGAPARLIVIAGWGSPGAYNCIDAEHPSSPVYFFEQDSLLIEPLRERGWLIPHRPSLRTWLESWLDGVDLFDELYPEDE